MMELFANLDASHLMAAYAGAMLMAAWTLYWMKCRFAAVFAFLFAVFDLASMVYIAGGA